MKQIILVVALFAFPVVSAAQDFTIKAGTPVQSAIDVIVACSGLKASTLDPGAYIDKLTLEADVAVQVCNTWSGWMAGIKKVLPSQFGFVVDQAGILHIRPVKPAATLTPEPTLNAGPATRNDADPALIEQQVQRKMFGDRLYAQIQAEKAATQQATFVEQALPINPPTVADPALIEQQVQLRMFGPAGYAQVQAQNAMSYGFGYSPYSYGSAYGSYGYSNYYPYYFLGPCRSFMPRIERPVACVQAAVTFKIEEDYLQDAILRIDGHNFGRVGQFRTRHVLPDRKLYLGADKEHVIQITRYTDDKHTQVWEDRIQPETIRMSGNRPIEIPVSEAVFENAPYSLDVVKTVDRISGKELVLGKPKQ